MLDFAVSNFSTEKDVHRWTISSTTAHPAAVGCRLRRKEGARKWDYET
jgi:hypothetical protein